MGRTWMPWAWPSAGKMPLLVSVRMAMFIKTSCDFVLSVAAARVRRSCMAAEFVYNRKRTGGQRPQKQEYAMDRTKQAICEAFSQLLEEKPISKISVREIAAQCGVARNTFYYHYRDIPTLLQQILEEVMDELVRRYYSPKSPVDCIRALLDYMKAHQKALLHIYRYLPREDFQAYLDRGAERLTARSRQRCPGHGRAPEDIEIMAHFYKCAVVGALLDWLDAGMDYDIKRIFFRVCVLLNGSGKRALLRARRMQAPEPTEGEWYAICTERGKAGQWTILRECPNF